MLGVLLAALGVPTLLAALVCVGLTTAVRLAAVLFGWASPEQRSWASPRGA